MMRPLLPLKRLLASLLTAAAFAASSNLHAALVTWDAPQNISGDSDVSTNGTLVFAVNFGGTGVPSTVVNGVLFQGAGTSSIAGGFTSNTAFGSAAAPFSNLSASYQTLLQSGFGLVTSPVNVNVTLLTVGVQYEVEVWSNNSAGGAGLLGVFAGNNTSLWSNLNNGLGQFVRGTFTADSNVQTVTFGSLGGTAVVNAFQIRALPAAVPEPGTALAGLALIGVVGLRRRRAV